MSTDNQPGKGSPGNNQDESLLGKARARLDAQSKGHEQLAIVTEQIFETEVKPELEQIEKDLLENSLLGQGQYGERIFAREALVKLWEQGLLQKNVTTSVKVNLWARDERIEGPRKALLVVFSSDNKGDRLRCKLAGEGPLKYPSLTLKNDSEEEINKFIEELMLRLQVRHYITWPDNKDFAILS